MLGSFPFNSGVTLPLGCRIGSFEPYSVNPGAGVAYGTKTSERMVKLYLSRARQKSTVLHPRPTIRDS